MKIKLYKDFINESGGIGGITVGGVNFGSEGGNVGSTFGEKGDFTFNKRGAMNPIDSSMIYSELKDKYYTFSEISEIQKMYDELLINDNTDSLSEIIITDGKTLDFIIRKLGN